MSRHEDEWETIARKAYEELAPRLDELAWMDEPVNDDLELATLQLTSREVRLYGLVFAEWLTVLQKYQVTLTPARLTRALKIACREKTTSMTRELLKCVNRHANSTPDRRPILTPLSS